MINITTFKKTTDQEDEIKPQTIQNKDPTKLNKRKRNIFFCKKENIINKVAIQPIKSKKSINYI